MYRCRELNTKGKFCGKAAVDGYPLCEKHFKAYNKQQEILKTMIDSEVKIVEKKPKFIVSCTTSSDDPFRRVKYTRNPIPTNVHSDVNNMTPLYSNK